MWVTIDLCIIPIGVGVSLSPYIAICQEIIEETGLKHQLLPNGTAIEGDWDEVLTCIKRCHEQIHSKGVLRIFSTVKLNTRTDRQQSFEEKVPKVLKALSDQKDKKFV